jgi:zona occludens toxin
MIYLTTGANGAGKTLLTLKLVHDKAIKESRPVYHNGRFEIVPDGPLAKWQKIEFKDWQTVPDGAIFLIDECHNELPVRTGKDVPEYIKMLAEHRRRGFDFYLITQHPNNIDAFVRRLIGSPGWHAHLKRASGAPLVSRLEWPSVNSNCEKVGSGESGQTSMIPYPKEVYSWYVSTSLDTAKIKVPFMVKVLAACAFAFPAIGWYGWHTFQVNQGAGLKALAEKSGAPAIVSPGQPAPSGPMNPAQFAESYTPRVDGLPYTAPRYDDATKPVTAPYPAACVRMGSRCDCYTQQGTKLTVPIATCDSIVKTGFFIDWQQPTTEKIKPLTGGPDLSPEPPPKPKTDAELDSYRFAFLKK